MYSVSEAGVLKKIETWQVIIPLHDNAGKAFDEATIEGSRSSPSSGPRSTPPPTSSASNT